MKKQRRIKGITLNPIRCMDCSLANEKIDWDKDNNIFSLCREGRVYYYGMPKYFSDKLSELNFEISIRARNKKDKRVYVTPVPKTDDERVKFFIHKREKYIKVRAGGEE